MKTPIWKTAIALIFGLNLSLSAFATIEDNDDKTSREKALDQVTYDIKYLASDELGGRQPGKPGMVLAEKYIVEQYKKAGLKPVNEDGTYFQDFSVGGEKTLNKESVSGKLTGPKGASVQLKLGENMSPLNSSRSFNLNAPLVFVGYGIKAKEHNFNEFKDVDVEGKVVVMIRREPQQKNPDSVFDGQEVSQFGFIRSKINNARRANAVGVILVNDNNTAPDAEQDELAAYKQFGAATSRMPTIHVKRSVLDEMLKASPLLKGDGEKLASLADVEKEIDANLSPISQPLEGWSIKATANIDNAEIIAHNIIGIIEGEGPHADETIVIGAHHDHLGMGAYGSRAQGRKEIHNGADDNATGTAAVMELARRFTSRDKKPARRLVFVCFSAEEMGLLGARHYVDNPSFPLEKTVAMINFDMIGWLRNDKLTLFNWNTSPQFSAAIDSANEGFNLNLVKPSSGFAGSDHLPFNSRQIPNIFFHTGVTDTYHTPEDDFETIDCGGALKVIEYCEIFVDNLCNLENAPTYGKPKPVRLGVILDDDNGKVIVEAVTEGSIAEKAGIKKGDVILTVGGKDVNRRRQVNKAVKKDAGKLVKFRLLRDGKNVEIEFQLKND